MVKVIHCCPIVPLNQQTVFNMHPPTSTDHHAQLSEWQRQIQQLRRTASPNAYVGIDTKSRKVTVTEPDKLAVTQKLRASSTPYEWESMANSINMLTSQAQVMARDISIREDLPAKVNPHTLASFTIKEVDDLLTKTLAAKSSRFAVFRQQLDQSLQRLQLKSPMNRDRFNTQMDALTTELFSGIGALQWSYHDDPASLTPHLTVFFSEWMINATQHIERSPASLADKQEIIAQLNGQLAMLMDSLQSSMILPPVSEATDSKSLSFRHLKTFNTPPSPPFYMEPQELQSCGRHAANAFFGGPLVEKPATDIPMEYDEVFASMQGGLREANDQQLFRTPIHISAYQGIFSDRMLQALNHLKGDRILILPNLSSHYLTFRKDQQGKWYKLESAAYEKHEQEQISPR